MARSSSGVLVGEGGGSICWGTGLTSGWESQALSAWGGGTSAHCGGPGSPALHLVPCAPSPTPSPSGGQQRDIRPQTSGSWQEEMEASGNRGPIVEHPPPGLARGLPIHLGLRPSREGVLGAQTERGVGPGGHGQRTARGPLLGGEGGEAGSVSRAIEPGGHPQLQVDPGLGSGHAWAGALPPRALP